MLLFSHRSSADLASKAGRLQWYYLSEQGYVTSGEVDAENLVSLVEQHPSWFETPDRVALMLTGEDIVHLNVSVPGRSIKSIRQALPFAIEEFITSDIDDVHIAHKAIRSNEPVHCAVINRERLEFWLPYWVAGEHMFVMTPNPIFKFLTRLVRNHLDAEMHEAEANPSFSPLLDEFHAASLFQHHFVTCPSIHVKNNRERQLDRKWPFVSISLTDRYRYCSRERRDFHKLLRRQAAGCNPRRAKQ